MRQQAVGSGSVLYHCARDVSGLKISTAAVYDDPVHLPATTSTDLRFETPGECLAIGMGGMVCFHFSSYYVYISLVSLQSLFFSPPTATSLPLTWPRPNHLTGSGGRVVHLSCDGSMVTHSSRQCTHHPHHHRQSLLHSRSCHWWL